MPSNSLLYFITKIIKFEGFKATNYHFITENELLIELENKATITTCPQKIKLIKRRGYGLTNFDNFRRRVLLNWHFC